MPARIPGVQLRVGTAVAVAAAAATISTTTTTSATTTTTTTAAITTAAAAATTATAYHCWSAYCVPEIELGSGNKMMC